MSLHTMTTDWSAWHDPYADPTSALSQRLRVVQSRVDEWLDDTAPAAVQVLSLCAGDGRDLLDVLAGRSDADRVTATLVDIDQRNVARARTRIAELGLDDTIQVRRADAGESTSTEGAVPADLVLACGIFGNISDDDVHMLVAVLPQLCARGALVVWTRHRAAPDLTPTIRRWFAEAGFDEVAFTAPREHLFTVGAHRFGGTPQPLVPGRRWFTFVR